MRHLPRLRGAVSASLCCSSPTHIRTTTAVAAVATTSSSSTKTQSLQRRTLSTSLPRSDAVEAYTPPQGLKPPPQARKAAVRPDKITDPAYEPAQDGLELEEVGGLDGWWENPDNYGVGRQWVGYGPAEKITDPAVLEVAVYRALVEAMVARRQMNTPDTTPARDALLESGWGPAALTATTVQTKLCGGSHGTLILKPAEDIETATAAEQEAEVTEEAKEQLEAAVRPEQEAEVVEAKEEVKTAIASEQVAEITEETKEEAETGVASEQETETDVKEEVDATEDSADHVISTEEARVLLKEIGHEWKRPMIKDLIYKYFVAKRIYKLTGHRIPDGKLVAINSGGVLLKEIVKPPKAKKLAEEIENKQLFQSLPNVKMFARRVTPIDKEKMVGRWKVIREELERRGLPVIGTADIDNAIEKKWVTGAK
ncbi:hypothetical protein QC761_403570 [Podospora bellae-mahoneyi]|uniref:Large ribosomal subunit protein mL50 n=1 Tax=Podospora bellae-mahoneyi TaxID=2093777 RepID=A0ABR0FGY7_9PEZI|nr:hypothetical protein QC761_403570 [Podospora bellae-mahoneyi]